MISDGLDGLVCDMDGVLYRGDVAIPGAAAAIARARARDIAVLFLTNNSRSTVADYVDKLAGIGIPASPDQILTSAVVTGDVLRSRGAAGSALVVGGEGIREQVAAAGMDIVDEPEHASHVVVGWDRDFTFARMTAATRAVLAGASFIATNDDASFPAPDGLWPGAGAILASIERATGKRAEVIGKPHRPMMEAAAARLAGRRDIAIVGDRPDTDLEGGRTMGWKTILVLSGVTDRDAVSELETQPDAVLDSIAGLF